MQHFISECGTDISPSIAFVNRWSGVSGFVFTGIIIPHDANSEGRHTCIARSVKPYSGSADAEPIGINAKSSSWHGVAILALASDFERRS